MLMLLANLDKQQHPDSCLIPNIAITIYGEGEPQQRNWVIKVTWFGLGQKDTQIVAGELEITHYRLHQALIQLNRMLFGVKQAVGHNYNEVLTVHCPTNLRTSILRTANNLKFRVPFQMQPES